MVLGSSTGMSFHFTHDISLKNWIGIFFYELPLKENIIFGLKRFSFKLTKLVIDFNYKEKVSWSFKSLGSGSFYKKGDSGSFPCIRDLTYSYPPNRCVIAISL